jgi:hypothetical protein
LESRHSKSDGSRVVRVTMVAVRIRLARRNGVDEHFEDFEDFEDP